jgi:16S rRNA processing protein RimM
MDELALGRIGAPHGLDGRLKVLSYSGEIGHFSALGTVRLCSQERTLQADIESVMPFGAAALVKFAGYDSPESARVLTGLEIWAPRQQAAPCGPDEYYIADLVGCIIHADGRDISSVEAVCSTGGGDLLEVCLDDKRRVLIPFRNEFIGVVDIKAGRIELIAPWILE